MVCSLTSDQVVTCSEYNINVSKYEEFFQCDLKQHNSSRGCGCLINVESGFVLSELFKVQVSRGKNVLFTKFVNTTESIKPKKPFRVTVNQTQNDNFLIVWETEYQVLGYVYVFSLDLISEIVYHVEGSKISTILNVTPSGRFKYELIGRNLKPNTNYIVRARIKSPLSNRFSDYSPAVKFTTPTSPDQIFKIIIPIVCVILILSVLIIYFFIDK
ncbi:Interleukin-4 receptor subunit alpha [Bagarius yarrelli]|uniref:Interleukin-4 receptor subunit alpha n=1 Tax=Bagarius yarrelli TaxID=175774 RepID=A0A556V2C1_BAGYA|nr:Interleukin-4 receptor subunit alpha [Bagarius yarrelli]